MDLSKIMSKVYLWMFLGLAFTFVTGSVVANNPTFIEEIFKGSSLIILFIVEIGLVIFLSARLHKMSGTTAKIMFLLYSFVTGLTFSSVFVIYNISSIIYVFLITAGIMLVMSLIGYFTKIDMTKFGTFLFMILIGIIIASIVNIFVGSETLSLGICIISVIVFVLYIAFDVQKIKSLYESNVLPEDNLAIYGALELYLDFINIFLDLLRFFGDNK